MRAGRAVLEPGAAVPEPDCQCPDLLPRSGLPGDVTQQTSRDVPRDVPSGSSSSGLSRRGRSSSVGASRAPAHPCLSFPTCKVGEEQPYLSPVSCSNVLGQCETQGPQPCCPARTPALQHSRSQFGTCSLGTRTNPSVLTVLVELGKRKGMTWGAAGLHSSQPHP